MANLADKRLFGMAVPLGSLKGSKPCALGEYPDLVELASFASKNGIGIIQILPVNDTGYESSPYSALSAFALNPIYLRLSDLSYAKNFEKQITELNNTFAKDKRFNYYKVAKAKLDLLWNIFAKNKADIAKDVTLQVWIEKNEWVKPYAVFRKLKDANEQRSWKQWEKFSKITPKQIDTLFNDPTPRNRDEHLFWCYVQYACDKQFASAADKVAAANIILKGDLPILLNEDSCDVWANPEFFLDTLAAGAPPDFYSPAGQNWGFPIYNWPAQQKDNFSWWKARLKSAERYFKAYRIDHILGFFRIWATKRINIDATLGRYVPYSIIKRENLMDDLGYNDGRIKWLSSPHIPTHEVWDALKNGGGNDLDVHRVFDTALQQINNEELWLFKDHIKGQKDIVSLGLHKAATEYLCTAWTNRVFCEYETDLFCPLWYYKNTRPYFSLNDEEKSRLEDFLGEKSRAAESKWELQGQKLLSVLAENTSMLACGEDLGAVNECVPRVMNKLKILSLRVVRWTCEYDKEGQPFVPYNQYPELSVCTTSVHDSSTLRGWWENEVDQNAFAAFNGMPSLAKAYTPGTARLFLKNVASASSVFFIPPLIDLLHLSSKWYAEDPNSERINVPGTCNDFNWTWRIPAPIADLAADTELCEAIAEVSKR
ncbi:MAG: hypothetical protein Ta2G_17470 [Termitinemataceae bacterium]|nr:MAG: hypothetical protein Ta2G_17470 [Termitinemataceae bacterium]